MSKTLSWDENPVGLSDQARGWIEEAARETVLQLGRKCRYVLVLYELRLAPQSGGYLDISIILREPDHCSGTVAAWGLRTKDLRHVLAAQAALRAISLNGVVVRFVVS